MTRAELELAIKKEQIKLIIENIKAKAEKYNALADEALKNNNYQNYRYYHAIAFENELFLIDLDSLAK